MPEPEQQPVAGFVAVRIAAPGEECGACLKRLGDFDPTRRLVLCEPHGRSLYLRAVMQNQEPVGLAVAQAHAAAREAWEECTQ